MISFSNANMVSSTPDVNIAPVSLIIAKMTFSGEDITGVQDETRTLTGLIVTNNGVTPVRVVVESEQTKESFSATIQPGNIDIIDVLPLEQYWNSNRAVPGWDGINIYWNNPA